MKQFLLYYIFNPLKQHFQTKTPTEPEYCVVSHFYEGQTVQVLIQDRTGKKRTHDIQSLGKQKSLITQMSATDAFLLGYLLAEDSVART